MSYFTRVSRERGGLSSHTCRLYNPDDRTRVLGQGTRNLLGDTVYDVVPELHAPKAGTRKAGGSRRA